MTTTATGTATITTATTTKLNWNRNGDWRQTQTKRNTHIFHSLDVESWDVPCWNQIRWMSVRWKTSCDNRMPWIDDQASFILSNFSTIDSGFLADMHKFIFSNVLYLPLVTTKKTSYHLVLGASVAFFPSHSLYRTLGILLFSLTFPLIT